MSPQNHPAPAPADRTDATIRPQNPLASRRTFTLAAFGTVGAVAVLAACGGGGGSAGDENTITVLMEEISYTDNIKEMLPDFQQASGVTVNIETVPYADQSSRILQEFAQGSTTYDVVFNDNVYGSGYYQSKYVANLADLAATDTEYGTLEDYYAPYLKPMKTDDGAVYGVPVYGESTFLMYRTDLFEQFGIAEAPQTTDELLAAAKTISEGTNEETAGMSMRGAAGIHAVYPWAGILRSFGGDFTDSAGKIDVNTPEAAKATEFWAELLTNYGPAGVTNFDWEQNRIAFTQGKVAMTIDATANGPYNEDASSSKVAGKVGYAAIPYAMGIEPGENTNNSLNVHALYLNAKSTKQAAAWKFMSWATSKTVQENAVATVEAVGVTNESVLNGDAYAQKYGPFQQAVLDQLKTGNINYLPSGQSANTVIVDTGQALSNVLSGQDEAAAALKTAQDDIDVQLKQ